MTAILEMARPKVNLTLEIRGRRADGYHELASLVVFAADPADRVTFDPGGPAGLAVTGSTAAGIEGPNLLERTLERVREAEPRVVTGAVQLEKVLPVAAGLGGGSADAAALLRAIRRSLPFEIAERIDWSGIALSLGADVPVCLAGKTAWMEGIGETLTPIGNMPRLPAVLVNPRVPVPADKTARVFRALAAPPLRLDAVPPRVPLVLTDARSQIAELARFGNDLTAAATAVLPVIGDVLRALETAEGCRLARLSGAGPTAYGLFDTTDEAASAAHAIARSRPDWWAVATTIGN